MEILATVFYIAVCLLLFSLAIAIHEFGHFIVALKLGLKVERFSIGFGPAIFKKTWRGVEYRLSWIPLGGYVSIPEVDPEGTKVLEGASTAASSTGRIPAWKELLVALAGPLMNVVLAVILAVVLALVPGVKFGELSSEVGWVEPSSVAARGGLRAGDVVTHVAGHPVSTWTQMRTELQIAGEGAREVTFRVLRAGQEHEVRLRPDYDEALGAVLLKGVQPVELPKIGQVLPGGPAEQAGLQPGDTVVRVAGESVRSWAAMTTAIQASAGREVELVVLRPEGAGEVEIKLRVTPVFDPELKGYYMKAVRQLQSPNYPWMNSRNPLQQLAWDAGSIFRALKGLVTPKEMKATGKAMGGSVMIAQGLYRSVRDDFWGGIGFLRFLNVNLAIVNLLPIPVLDGGLILFALIALVFRRRVPNRIVSWLSTGFMWVLLSLMAILIFRDVQRGVRMNRKVQAAQANVSSKVVEKQGEATADVHAERNAGAESR